MSRKPILDQPTIDRALGRKRKLTRSDWQKMVDAVLPLPKRSKYGVRLDAAGKLRRTLDGRIYHSAAERDHAAKLELDRKCGKITGWDPQVAFDLRVNGKVIGKHVVDFLIYDQHEGERVEEVKGHKTELWRWKKAHFEAQYPEIPYIVIPARKVL